jgi:dihydrofolate reductase
MASFWPTADQDPKAPARIVEFAGIWRSRPRYVFSTTLAQADHGCQHVPGDVGVEVGKLKKQIDGNLSVGGAGLGGSLLKLGLVDELRLFVRPVLLGGGTPCFPQMDGRTTWNLVESRTFPGGVVMLRYARALWRGTAVELFPPAPLGRGTPL